MILGREHIMSRITKIYLPSMSIAFFFTMVYICLANLASGSLFVDIRFIIGILGFIASAEVMDALLGNINFQSYRGYFIAETAAVYILLVVFAYYGNWIDFTVPALVCMTAAYLAIMSFLHFYFYRRSKQDADQINSLLNRKSRENN